MSYRHVAPPGLPIPHLLSSIGSHSSSNSICAFATVLTTRPRQRRIDPDILPARVLVPLPATGFGSAKTHWHIHPIYSLLSSLLLFNHPRLFPSLTHSLLYRSSACSKLWRIEAAICIFIKCSWWRL